MVGCMVPLTHLRLSEKSHSLKGKGHVICKLIQVISQTWLGYIGHSKLSWV